MQQLVRSAAAFFSSRAQDTEELFRMLPGMQEDTQEEEQQEERRLWGYAIRFNENSVPLYDPETKRWFVERIMPGAVDESLISDTADFHMYREHRKGEPIATTRNGTLWAIKTEQGVFFSALLNKTRLAEETYDLVADGTLRGCSFGYFVAEDEWVREQGYWVHIVHKMRRITEMSVVLDPAFQTTHVEGEMLLRSVDELQAYEQAERDKELAVQHAAYMASLRAMFAIDAPTA